MNFNIQNPTPRLAWNQEEGSAGVFSFDNKPLSAFWYNAHDQDGNTIFVASFPDCQQYRDEIEQAIEADLFADYSYQEKNLHSKLGRLFELLPSGKYNLYTSNSEENVRFPAYPSSNEAIWSHQVDYFKFLFPVTPPLSKLSHLAWYEKGWETERKVEKTTTKVDEGLDNYLISTIPASYIDPERVRFYEDALKKGRRPAAIVFRCFEAYGEAFNYVIDGHCKLLAYANLSMMPHIIFITQEQVDPVPSPWDLTPFIYLLSPWQAHSFLEHDSSFKLQDSQGNFETLRPFIKSSITESIEVFWAQDRIIRQENYFKNGEQTAWLYLGYMNDRPSTSFRYTAQDRKILYNISGNQLTQVMEHSVSNGELLLHQKWNEEKGMLEDVPIEKPAPIKEYKASSAKKGVYKPLKPRWREKYKNEIYYVGMGLIMLFALLRLIRACS